MGPDRPRIAVIWQDDPAFRLSRYLGFAQTAETFKGRSGEFTIVSVGQLQRALYMQADSNAPGRHLFSVKLAGISTAVPGAEIPQTVVLDRARH